jgi:hypothetical protein
MLCLLNPTACLRAPCLQIGRYLATATEGASLFLEVGSHSYWWLY